jgi:hypothetical protein
MLFGQTPSQALYPRKRGLTKSALDFEPRAVGDSGVQEFHLRRRVCLFQMDPPTDPIQARYPLIWHCLIKLDSVLRLQDNIELGQLRYIAPGTILSQTRWTQPRTYHNVLRPRGLF